MGELPESPNGAIQNIKEALVRRGVTIEGNAVRLHLVADRKLWAAPQGRRAPAHASHDSCAGAGSLCRGFKARPGRLEFRRDATGPPEGRSPHQANHN